MNKLIITSCECDNSMYPGLPKVFTDPKVVAESTLASWKAGASIVHIHGPYDSTGFWADSTRLIRERCDVLIQYGISAHLIEVRREVIKLRPDMLSVASMHNLHFVTGGVYGIHKREELLELCRTCRGEGIKPEFEIFGLGDVWTLEWLIEQGVVDPPYYVTLFFGRPGGQWSPATLDEYSTRVRHLPPDTIYTVSVTGPEHLQLEVTSMLAGGHVRVGREDEPHFFPGVLAGSNLEIVERVASIAKAVGGEIATTADARQTLKMPKTT